MLTSVLISLATVLVGLCAGTWIDHAAAAIPARRAARSLPACPQCATPWRGLTLVPLVGPLLARRCGNCDAPIGWLRPLTEATTAILFALALWRFGFSAQFVATAIFCVVLLVILRIDWRHHLIFQNTILIGLMIALAYAAIASRQPNALLWSSVGAVGAAFLFLVLYGLALAIYKRRALGFGDVLLAALIGAMAGADTAMALMIGMVLGAGGGLLLVALRVRTMRDYIPYGAYLCAGTIITLLAR
jgi:prepilin signal peptidase PulO-like enzyme (type II secretory pathway)